MPGAEARDEFVEFRDHDSRAGTVKRVDQLMKLLMAGKITPEQYDGGNAYRELREAWERSASGQKPFEDFAGGVSPADPFAGWYKAVRYNKDGKPVREPRTFAYKRPKSPKTAGDGFAASKCDAMQAHLRIFRVFRATPELGQVIFNKLVVERESISAAALSQGWNIRKNRHHNERVWKALHSTLDALTAELQPAKPGLD